MLHSKLGRIKQMPPLLELRDITKRFPGVLANDHINLSVRAGEVHALLGENGAGKSTLMNILYGLYERDGGEIFVRGERATIESPADAIALGIGMIHQDFMLIPRFTVVENVVMGEGADDGGPLLNLQDAALRLEKLSKMYGLAVDPHARVADLSVGEEQRVEILKLLYRDATVLIMDEPTAVLTPQECEALFGVLRTLAEQGHAIIFITHKLHEVMTFSNRVTVLRDGQVVAVRETEDTDSAELAHLMVGREVNFQVDRQPHTPGDNVLEVSDLRVLDNVGRQKVRGVSFAVRQGEILGLAGVEGNGQSELAEALMNLREVQAGTVRVAGTDVTHRSPAQHRESGIGYIPADRRKVGSVGELSIAENSILGALESYTRLRRMVIHDRRVQAHARKLVQDFDVRTPSVTFAAGKLSGGNLQKVVLGRELMHDPQVLIVEQPTRGLDVGAAGYVRRQLIEERQRGMAILLISAELEEILALSDRIAVMFAGQLMGIVHLEDADMSTLGLMMGGTRIEELPTGALHE
ncbi:MAG: ABC transporter ATP-binding protein [Chloroflexota bacterium]